GQAFAAGFASGELEVAADPPVRGGGVHRQPDVPRQLDGHAAVRRVEAEVPVRGDAGQLRLDAAVGRRRLDRPFRPGDLDVAVGAREDQGAGRPLDLDPAVRRLDPAGAARAGEPDVTVHHVGFHDGAPGQLDLVGHAGVDVAPAEQRAPEAGVCFLGHPGLDADGGRRRLHVDLELAHDLARILRVVRLDLLF